MSGGSPTHGSMSDVAHSGRLSNRHWCAKRTATALDPLFEDRVSSVHIGLIYNCDDLRSEGRRTRETIVLAFSIDDEPRALFKLTKGKWGHGVNP